MTTLAANSARTWSLGDVNDFPVVATDIIYDGAAVGLVKATGHARPLTSVDRFVGFAIEQCDNSTGAAAAKTVKVRNRGQAQLTVSGVTITDVGQPVFAADDNAFQMSPVGGVFIGFVQRFVESGVAIVAFDPAFTDPYAAYGTREAVSQALTLDAQDCGKLFWVTADAGVITLPAIADGLAGCLIVNGGSYGTVLVTVSPGDANDMILATDLAGVNDKDLLNTKATAQRGDRVRLINGDADGYLAIELVGVWAKQG